MRKPSALVLIYEGIVAQVLDYDYAPSSEMVESRRMYFNISQVLKGEFAAVVAMRATLATQLLDASHTDSMEYGSVCFQEGKSDLDFLREEELINGLKISSKDHLPTTMYQISLKVC